MPIQNVDISTSPSSKTAWQDDRTSGVFSALAVSNDGNVLCLSLVSICLYNGWQRTMNYLYNTNLMVNTWPHLHTVLILMISWQNPHTSIENITTRICVI